MLKRILRTIALVLGIIVYLPAMIVETVAAILIAFAGGLSFMESIELIAFQCRNLWVNGVVAVFNLIWDKDETEEEEAE